MSAIFLLTPLREGRLTRLTKRRRLAMHFYSRPCGRGDADGLLRASQDDGISTHAPAGGATERVCYAGRENIYFYSRPCGRGDLLRHGDHGFFHLISTHAPAGGATQDHRGKGGRRYSISTHAPAGGATRSTSRTSRRTKFLLTPLREGRPHGSGRKGAGSMISTHAPAGGATFARNS